MIRFMFLVLMMSSLNACAVQTVHLNVTVLDDENKPVEGAFVKGSFFQDQVVNNLQKPSHHGVTNSDGRVELSGSEEIYVDIQVTKPDYYTSSKRISVREDNAKSAQIILREMRNPIAMYAKTVVLNASGDRKPGKQFGYDMVVVDFVKPYGKGLVNDLLISHSYQKKDAWNYSFEIIISFSNPMDGLIPFYVNNSESKFISNYLAPVTGYSNTLILNESRTSKTNAAKGNYDRLHNYYIRIRSVENDRNEIVSALYGKIYGEFPNIQYYINPTPNDRNIEFNPNKNLLKRLTLEEQVNTP